MFLDDSQASGNCKASVVKDLGHLSVLTNWIYLERVLCF